jgi:hypothetical protein
MLKSGGNQPLQDLRDSRDFPSQLYETYIVHQLLCMTFSYVAVKKSRESRKSRNGGPCAFRAILPLQLMVSSVASGLLLPVYAESSR